MDGAPSNLGLYGYRVPKSQKRDLGHPATSGCTVIAFPGLISETWGAQSCGDRSLMKGAVVKQARV
jgi:hypothetical protein